MTTYSAVVMAAPCPKCHQPARSRCVKPSGQQRLEPHTARVPDVETADERAAWMADDARQERRADR